MIGTPEIVASPEQPTAAIRLCIPRAGIGAAMGPALAEVMAALAAQDLAPAGPAFSRHFRIDPALFDFEVGVPVARPLAPAGRVIASRLPAARVAQVVYRGPYQGLGAAWGEFCAWLQAERLAPRQELWERYLSGAQEADPAACRTLLVRPLAD